MEHLVQRKHWSTRERLRSALAMYEWGYYEDAFITIRRIIDIEVDGKEVQRGQAKAAAHQTEAKGASNEHGR